jgi:5-methylcytosine-specific restriction endonuclease McrA
MAAKKTPAARVRQDHIIAEALRYRDQREKTYRGQALKLYPWICARCGREFSGKKLRELTVHHKDHNHDNNPPDGSNWELLCLYCHDNEHARQQVADAYGEAKPGEEREPASTYRPFAELANLLQRNR